MNLQQLKDETGMLTVLCQQLIQNSYLLVLIIYPMGARRQRTKHLDLVKGFSFTTKLTLLRNYQLSLTIELHICTCIL